MRLCLGGLLGVIGGIMFSLDETELETYNLSIVVVAFLMGYSVEFAFTLFDHLIERTATRPYAVGERVAFAKDRMATL